MVASSLAPLCVTGLRFEGGTLFLEAEGENAACPCPDCGVVSCRVRARYRRYPLDLPWRGFVVRLAVRVRRFRCDNEACTRRTFAEEFGAILGRRRRFTTVVQAILADVAAALGGRAGARLAARQGAPTSRDTLLRLLRDAPAADPKAPRVLGVDDLALRRGRRYATLLMDMETHEPIELLEGREAQVLADWLKAHPSVAVIVRDRGGAYAEGARQGAPDATQVADRFHVAQNVNGALDEAIKRRPWALPTQDETDIGPSDVGDDAAVATIPANEPPASPTAATDAASQPPRALSPSKQLLAEQRAARAERWRRVHELRAQGGSLRSIADALGINKATVQHLLRCDEPPHNVVRHPRPGGIDSPKLAPYTAYLQQRWQAGCTNGCQLFREVIQQGYGGSCTLLLEAIRSWRPPRLPTPLRHRSSRRRPDARKRRWLLLRPPEQLDAVERAALDLLLTQDAALAKAHDLAHRFRRLLHDRDLAGFHTWLAEAQASDLPSFVGLANGMLADRAAVDAAFTEIWSKEYAAYCTLSA